MEREPRRISILSIKIEEIALPTVTMTVACSRGTYIRTLCHDIGQALGCGAAMESLLRTRSGQFVLETSVKLSEVQRYADEGHLDELVLPPDSMFMIYEKAVVTGAGEKLLYNGNPMPLSLLELPVAEEQLSNGEGIRIYDRAGNFIGLYRYQKSGQLCKPEILFLGKC